MKTKFYIFFLLATLIGAVGMRAQDVNRLSLSDTRMSRGTESTVTLTMDNFEAITAVEFLLTLPDGFSINTASVALSSRKVDHTVTARKMKNNTFKVMVYSPSNAVISGIAGELLTFTLKAATTVTDETDYQVSFTDAVMANRSGENVLDETKPATVQIASLPNLHVISVDCSEPVAGSQLNVKWKVRNDGRGSTRDTEWKDYIWLIPDIQGNALMIGQKLLATVNNTTALQPGEYYERSVNVQLEKRIYGNYYIVVTSDMYSVRNVDFSSNNNEVPNPYEPATASYGYFKGYDESKRDNVQEEGEGDGWSDNFFYKAIEIAVPPLPDLQVTKVTVIVDNSITDASPLSMAGLASSTAFYSGKHVLVTATIANKGGAAMPESTFVNDAYLSSAEKHEDAELIHLSRENLTVALEPEESIDLVFSGQIPYDWSGETWFHVCTDSGDAVYELANIENNWWHTSQVDVLLTPGADFEISDLRVPSTITTAVPFDVSYTVTNIGPGAPYSNTWKDKVYISKSATGLDNSAICIGTFTQKGSFNGSDTYTGDTYTVTRNIQTSRISTGTYYIYVEVDADHAITEFDGEDNNVICSGPVACTTADLTAELVSIPDETLYAGSSVAVTWKVKNIGAGDVSNAKVTDAFYVGASANASLEMIGYISKTLSIASGGEKTFRCNLKIPENRNIYGSKYIFVKTNYDNGFSESNTNNNFSAGIQRTIEPRQIGMNLNVGSLSVPKTMKPGQWTEISYTVTNNGTSAISQNVLHEVYLSDSRELNNAILCEVANTPPSVEGLQSDGMITVNQKIMVPADKKGGYKYVIVVVNGKKSIQEADYTDNKRDAQTFVNGNLPDLVITENTIPDVITTSTPTPITLTIENQGQWDASATTCQVLLDKPRSEAIPLIAITVPPLKKGESTVLRGTITIDDAYIDAQTLIVNPNYKSQIATMRSADRILRKAFTSVRAILPDLVMTDISVDDNLRAGETATVHFSVQNIGDDATHKNKWTDGFYLSTGFSFDVNKAIFLSEKAHTGILKKGESYEVTAQLNIPSNVHGYYFLYAVTDSKNIHFENDKDNNIIKTTVYIADGSDTPADLAVVSATAPVKITAGEPISISYSIVNNGLYAANGTLRDVIYLSKDAQWDEEDTMVGAVAGKVNIEPGNTLTRTATGRITNVVEGSYYFIVKTNSTHSIPETDYDNNHAVQTSASTVAFATFPLGASTAVTTSGYFKLPVSGGNIGQTLGFYLNHDEETPAGLYVSYNQVPSTARYEYASTTIETAEQEVLVPNVQEGTYYILAQANSAIGQNVNKFVLSDIEQSEEVPMSLSARVVPFGATSLTIKEGGADGWLSTGVHGALLDSIMDFRLVREADVIPVEAVNFNDQTYAIATFNLIDAPTGSYDVVSELPNGTQATMPNGFTVMPGHSVSLGVKLDLPNASRTTNYAPVAIAYANGGNTDISIKELLVVAEGATLATTIEGLKEMKREIHVIPDFPTDRRGYINIPPGTHEVINCFIGASNGCTVTVYIVK